METFSFPTHVGLVCGARCPATGLLVATVKLPSPVSRAYITVKTEAVDHSGATHALEHLVFSGAVGCRETIEALAACHGATTNAVTECDRTTYTLDALGGRALLERVLPVYLQHLLAPTLSENDFLTEVHHVDGTGRSGGVVYEEVAQVTRDSHSIIWQAAAGMAFPEDCCYGKDCGGKPSDLIGLRLEDVRATHSRLYRPDRMFVLVTSPEDLEPSKLVTTLAVKTGVRPPSLPEPLPWSLGRRSKKSRVVEVPLPDVCEGDSGIAIVLWGGPLWRERTLCVALEVLISWLVVEKDGLLREALVGGDDPICGEVDAEVLEQDEAVIGVTCTGVRDDVTAEHLKSRIEKGLGEALDSANLRASLAGVRRVARRRATEGLLDAEQCPADWLASQLNRCFAGRSTTVGADGEGACREAESGSLAKWKDVEWDSAADWLRAPFVAALGVPSEEAARASDEQAKALLEQRRADPAGLVQCRERLETAVAKQREKKSRGPSCAGAPASSVAEAAEILGKVIGDGRRSSDCSNPVDMVNIGTSFVASRFSIELTGDKSEQDTALLALWSEASLAWSSREEKPARDWKAVLAHTADTGAACAWCVGSGPLPRVLTLSVVAPQHQYEKAVEIVVRNYRDSVFDPERLEIAAAALSAGAEEAKKDGETLVGTCMAVVTQTEWAAAPTNPFRTAALLGSGLVERAPSELQLLRDRLDKSTGTQVRVGCWAGVKDPLEPWTRSKVWGSELTGLLAKDGREWPVSSVALFVQAEPGTPLDGCLRVEAPLPSDDFDFAAAVVGTSELTKEEGVLWTAVRGTGLGYSLNLSVCPERGSVVFEVWSTSSPRECFEAAAAAVSAALEDGETNKKQRGLEEKLNGAKLSVLVSIAKEVETPLALLEMMDAERLNRRFGVRTSSELVSRVAELDAGAVRAALRHVVLPLFDGGPRVAVATVPSDYTARMDGFVVSSIQRTEAVAMLSEPCAGHVLRELLAASA